LETLFAGAYATGAHAGNKPANKPVNRPANTLGEAPPASGGAGPSTPGPANTANSSAEIATNREAQVEEPGGSEAEDVSRGDRAKRAKVTGVEKFSQQMYKAMELYCTTSVQKYEERLKQSTAVPRAIELLYKDCL